MSRLAPCSSSRVRLLTVALLCWLSRAEVVFEQSVLLLPPPPLTNSTIEAVCALTTFTEFCQRSVAGSLSARGPADGAELVRRLERCCREHCGDSPAGRMMAKARLYSPASDEPYRVDNGTSAEAFSCICCSAERRRPSLFESFGFWSTLCLAIVTVVQTVFACLLPDRSDFTASSVPAASATQRHHRLGLRVHSVYE